MVRAESIALLGGVLYFVDERGRLCSIKEEGVVTECDEPMEPAAICAGVGGCGNYRIFIADSKDKTLKVFDPLNRRLDTLAGLPGRPSGLAKEECRLAVSLGDEILFFDLKTLQTVERIKV